MVQVFQEGAGTVEMPSLAGALKICARSMSASGGREAGIAFAWIGDWTAAGWAAPAVGTP
jgi:hypothetical protein